MDSQADWEKLIAHVSIANVLSAAFDPAAATLRWNPIGAPSLLVKPACRTVPAVEATPPTELEQRSKMLFVRRRKNGVSGVLQQGSGELSERAPAGDGAASSGTNLHRDASTTAPQRCYITPCTLK